MEEHLINFEEKGYPKIKVFETYFDIKAIDYWEYRSFKFSEVKFIDLKRPYTNGFWNFIFSTSLIAQVFSDREPMVLKIYLKNGGDWEYQSSYKEHKDFKRLIRYLNRQLQT